MARLLQKIESFPVIQKLQIKPDGETGVVNTLRNRDIIPLPPSRRLWGYVAYLSFWGITNLNITTYTAASSLLSVGMNVGETMGIIVVGNFIVASIALLNAAPGGYYHIGYTICQRLIFGIRGSYFGLALRIILSIVWFASQSWLGGLCLGMVFSSWSKNYLTMSNTFPDSVHMTRRDLISFLCYQIIQLPVLCIKPEKIDKFVSISCFITVVGMISIVSWAVHHNGGNGPLMHSPSSFDSTSAHAWAWIYGITSWYGSLSAGITNQSDYTRFSTKTWVSLPGTFIAMMVAGTMVPLMGLVTASATYGKYGTQFWSPDQIIELWLTNEYSARSRAASFFVALFFVLSQLCFNAIGNGFAGGMDLAGLFPKYINIRRGALITALLSWVIQPWDIYNTSSTFVTVMSAFSVFMSPIIGIIISEFWILRDKKLKLTDLYSNDRNGNYWYWYGINWKAIVAFFVASAPGIPGLINSATPSIYVNNGIKQYYDGNCIFGLLIAGALNIGFNFIFPSKNLRETDDADYFNTFTAEECEQNGLTSYQSINNIKSEVFLESDGK